MRDYWLTQYLLAAVGWGYIILALIVLGLALWIPERKAVKLVAGAVVLGLASILPIEGYKGYLAEKRAAQEFTQRQAKARALFEERCKTAGEKIYRTVEDVDGVLLLKVRKREGSEADPMAPSAAAWNQSEGDFYIYNLLFNEEPAPNPYGVSVVQTSGGRPGFKYVEVIDPSDGKRYRYTWKPGEVPKKEPSPSSQPPRYAIDYEDFVDQEDRQYWIARSSVRIVDTHDDSVMAELMFLVFEPGLGSKEGFRQPWAFAVGCPNLPVINPMHRFFANKVLRSDAKVRQ